ncbi:hypothetical protein BKA82DRAFT_2694324 [Pisolithus tinctorius]|nr:hypothetical protein BKA82DRAFT_2694324 [Pisolithus tinctorius]
MDIEGRSSMRAGFPSLAVIICFLFLSPACRDDCVNAKFTLRMDVVLHVRYSVRYALIRQVRTFFSAKSCVPTRSRRGSPQPQTSLQRVHVTQTINR